MYLIEIQMIHNIIVVLLCVLNIAVEVLLKIIRIKCGPICRVRRHGASSRESGVVLNYWLEVIFPLWGYNVVCQGACVEYELTNARCPKIERAHMGCVGVDPIAGAANEERRSSIWPVYAHVVSNAFQVERDIWIDKRTTKWIFPHTIKIFPVAICKPGTDIWLWGFDFYSSYAWTDAAPRNGTTAICYFPVLRNVYRWHGGIHHAYDNCKQFLIQQRISWRLPNMPVKMVFCTGWLLFQDRVSSTNGDIWETLTGHLSPFTTPAKQRANKGPDSIQRMFWILNC